MNHLVAPLVIWLLFTGTAFAQAVPKITKAGSEAFDELMVACRNAGVLRVVGQNGPKDVVAFDAGKLKTTLAAHPQLLTPDLRDAIVSNWFRVDVNEKLIHVALVRAYAEAKNDTRAQAFAEFFTAVHQRERKPADALPYYQRAERHFAELGDAAWQAICLTDAGLTYYQLAEYPLALGHLENALAAWRTVQLGPHPGVANCYGNLGLVFHSFGELGEALDYHQKALDMRRRLSEEPSSDVAQSLYNLGAVCHSQGDYARALEHYGRALVVLRQVHDEPHHDIALALDNIGTAYASLGESEKALDHLRQGLAMRRQLSDVPSREIAQSLHNLGTAFSDIDENELALDYFQHSLGMKRQLYDGPHADIALTLHNLGSVCSDTNDRAKSIDYYRQALAMWRKLYQGPHPNAAASLYNLASVHRRAKDPRMAMQALDDALAELQVLGDVPPAFENLRAEALRPVPVTVRILQRRGEYHEEALPQNPAAGQLTECQRCYALAAEVLDRVRQEALVHKGSKLRAGAEAVSLAPRRVGICLRLYESQGDIAHLRAAFAAAEQGRARVFLDALGRSRAGLLGGISPRMREQEERLLFELRSCDVRIERAESQPGETDLRVSVLWQERREIETSLQELAAEMEIQSPQYAAWKYPSPCSITEARNCLLPGETALHFVLGVSTSYVFVLEEETVASNTAKGLAIYRLPGRDTIGDLVSAVVDRDTLSLPSRLRFLGSELFDVLFGPLAKHIQAKDLVIIPDGPLCYLPFEALIEDNRYLVENHRIRYAPSLTALHVIRRWASDREHQPDLPLYALGDPVYGPEDERLPEMVEVAEASARRLREYMLREGAAAPDFSRLVHSGEELQAIGGLFGSEHIVTGMQATEAEVKRASQSGRLARFRYLHLATHGILGFDVGQQPALVLSLIGSDGRRDEFGTNDGFLRLDEVTGLALNADLVVLSACRTGEGRLYNGEGVVGLSRAFMHAGARGVVCSLWSVDDRETARFMTVLYGKLKDGRSVVDALHEAKLEMIRGHKTPSHWAPFVLIGDSAGQ